MLGPIERSRSLAHPLGHQRLQPDWVYVAKDRVYRSTDRGENWWARRHSRRRVYSPRPRAKRCGRLYVAKEFNLYRSTDGQSFDALDVPNGFSWITDIEVNPADGEELWISLSNYNNDTKVLHSTDGAADEPSEDLPQLR